MASEPKFHDRVMQVSTTAGAGTYTLGATVRGYQSFAVVGNGNSTLYAAYDCDGAGNPVSGGWETGIGTYTAAGTLLSRDSIIESSNANAAVVWGPGTRRIFVPPVSSLFSGAADGAVFRRSGNVFGMGALNLASVNAVTGILPFANLSAFINPTTNYLLYQDQKAQNTSGGTFTQGAWQTRTLNTEVVDGGGYGTLAANQLTLSAGTYIINARVPAFYVSRHQARLQNVTDATTVVWGTSEYSNNGVSPSGIQSYSAIVGQFTIAASKALEIQHRCELTTATRGFGVEGNFGTEVYTSVELRRIA